MPVAIAGMHRSGTSMVAHALHLAGLYLGDECDLYNERTADNPDGYWENARFVAVNDEILGRLGGGWDRPPRVPSSWGDEPGLRGVRFRAKRLVAGFAGREPWGWKDPRNTLTAPLWSELVPGLKVVVCLRNPLEVALSLRERFHSYSTGFELWQTYNRWIVETIPEDRRIVTDYERWLARPGAEARRILDFAGLPTGKENVERACGAVTPQLHRQRATARDLLQLDVSPEIVELYAWLRTEARRGAATGRRRTRPLPPEGPSAAPKVSTAKLDNQTLRRRIARLEARLAERDEALRGSLAIEQEERLRRVELSERWAQLLERLDRLERAEAPPSLAADVTGELERVSDRIGELEERLTRRLGDLVAQAEERLTGRLGEVSEHVEQAVEQVHASVYDVEARLAESGPGGSAYARLVRRVREVARREIPAGATVLVISKGDEDLLELYGRRGWHFPRAADGQWAGYHPKSGLPAIAHLEALRAHGADHLLIPATSLWWLTEHPDLARHLADRYRLVHDEDAVGALYRLSEPAADGESWRVALRGFLADFRARAGRDPVVLDWNTGLELRRAFPGETVFSPPVNGEVLHHLDGTVDVVVTAGADSAAGREAERVASGAVVNLLPGSANGSSAEVRWKLPPEAALPSASIVIPCYDGLAHTKACVTSLRETLPPALDVEIVVVDDASGDGTAEWLAEAAAEDGRLVVLRNRRNAGFLRSTNRGAEAASGEILVFLNNDTVLLPGWLEPLLDHFRGAEGVGAAGGRLLYPDGRLQEAGGLVFADGSAWKVGYRDPDPEAPLYSVARDVDYCSGCLLSTPRGLFAELGGFDRRFAPGFYEDTDYCFRVREHGLRVLYEPASSIVHVEGATAGTDLDVGPKRYQSVNLAKFARKWRRVLVDHPARPESFEPVALEALLWR